MTLIKYLGEVGFKFDWQTWLKLVGADGIFYDTTKPNNNLNKKSSNYSAKHDYELYVVTQFDVSQGPTGPITTYEKVSPICRVLDYNESAVDPRQWSVVITVKDTDGNNLNGNINVKTNVVMEALWTIASGTLPAEENIWAIHRIQEFGGGINIYEFSSLRENLASGPNPLKPVTGETMLKVEVISSTEIKTTCLIDGTLLVKGKNYNISARIGTLQQNFSLPEILLENIIPDTVTGITSFDVSVDTGFGVLNNLDTIEINVYRTDTEELLETITGMYGDGFADLVSSLGSNSVTSFTTGTMSDGETLGFDKYSWAVATGRTDGDAVALRFDATITNFQTGLTSSIGSGIFTVETKDGTDY